MQYMIYNSNETISINYNARDIDNGIIGSLDGSHEAVGTAATLEDAIEAAYAHVGRFPNDLLYVVDSNRLVYDMVTNNQYHDDQTSAAKSLFIAWASFTICVLSFVFTAITGLGMVGILLFVAILAVYLCMVRYGPFNEIESLVVCIVLSTLVLALIPSVNKIINASQNAG